VRQITNSLWLTVKKPMTTEAKPPNILIYSSRNVLVYQRLSHLLANALEPDCYVVYPFEEKCHSDAWIDNTCLLVVDSFAPNEEFDLSEYVLNRRGLCLSLDSSPPGFAVGESYEIQLDGTNWIRHGTPSGGVLIQPSPQSKDLTSITAVLDKGFGLKCQNEHSKAAVIPSKTAAFLVAQPRDEKLILERLSRSQNRLQLGATTVQFTPLDMSNVTDDFLPVVYGRQPDKFNSGDYFQKLKTSSIGRVVLYSDVMDSTHWLVEMNSLLPHGVVVVTRRQLRARGRSGNVWVSPEGCVTFSLRTQFSLQSELGKHLPLIQHLTALALVAAIKQLPGCKDLKLGLKWPNDIYYDGKQKIGGVLVTTSIAGSEVTAAIGCGLNLDNRRPTTCLNRIIEDDADNAQCLSMETLLAVTFNEFERLLNMLHSGAIERFLDLYHRNWLHSGVQVRVRQDSLSATTAARVLSLDQHGFLLVRKEDGSIVSVHPDGNSFDMLNGLIVPK